MIVFATIAVALVTMGILILVAKGLLKRVVDEEERPGLDGWLTVSLLPDEDGGPLTSKAQLLIMLFPEEVGGPQA